ncbi:hypothetical protein AGMMS50284_5480 [Clostridia bacterium]|nr:hypothetical protein AGMMS50284_5480 [Clostridia bacterium]
MLMFSNIATPLAAQAADEPFDIEAVNSLDKLAYSGNDLGAVYSKASTTFKVWAPTASAVTLNLYKTGSDTEKGAAKISSSKMQYNSGVGMWSLTEQGDLAGVYYTYTIAADGKENEVTDIYAKAVGVNGNRGMVVDLESTNPKNWDADKLVLLEQQTDAVVWEIHVRDFSNQKESGISEANRGKYLAFTETNTTLNNEGNIPTCINYLKKLGITHVQINPFYDFGSIDESKDNGDYNWGYDPKNYNVPEGSYSSNPYDGNVRINETKQMIQALHNANIGVIMDVVYNHTYTGEDSFFNMTVPNYYYRINQFGEWSNGSACGNDTASERKMFRKFMVDSVTYWAKEYHLDGFRFDLMGLHDIETMNEIRSELDKIDKRIIIYGEAWNLYSETDADLAYQRNIDQLGNRVAAFNDGMRDAIKGSNFDIYGKGFVQGASTKWYMQDGIVAATDQWAATPSNTVTYASCHDNFTLYDKLTASVKGKDFPFKNRDEQLVKMNKLAAASIFTSQGMPFILAGEELARSKDGDDNSYISSPELNQIDWTNLTKFGDLTAYYTGLIELRKAFAPLRDSTKTTINNIKFFENTDNRIVAYSIDNKLNQNEWQKIICIFNSDTQNDIKVNFEGENLPADWVVIANETTAGVISLGELTANTVTVPKTSALILVDKKSFNISAIKQDESTQDFKEYISKYIALEISQDTSAETIEQSVTEPNNNNITNTPIIPAAIAGVVILGAALLLKKRQPKIEN